ncbi:MAG: nitroreductase family deazaflavin-dependent oxidoreductase [Terriglobales bacterium]
METAFERIKRVAGRQTTVLTHYGRKTGQPHQVTIWFVVDGDRLYLGTASVKRNWVKNVQANPRIKLQVAGETFDATARFLRGDEHERAMRAVRRKYWMFSPIIQFGRLLCALGILDDNSGSFEVTLQ